ncbi:MAG: Fe-S cluster assembly ATPase SufC [Bdellovibrionaceae bacterium]|jgi:Fe-S cluster assembly ATP-binding protein|nr:Fe-S cluster assembly ATPase SufC [Pseudobdellovibrionaceae bacterium]
MLKIKNLKAAVDGTEILKGLNLEVKAGEVHAIMGPNGSGKSTLSKVVAGHPSYEVTAGDVEFEINFKYKNLLELSPDERAKEGVFLAFQYPVEVPGVSNIKFLQTAFNSVCKHQGSKALNEEDFLVFLKEKAKIMGMKDDFFYRAVNAGFSGGEKKKNEILQMAVLSPRVAFLDETDSGLDIDALRVVSNGINQLKNKHNAIVLVTHYQRLLDYIKPDYVHVLSDGKIIETGDFNLAKKLEDKGYDWLVH